MLLSIILSGFALGMAGSLHCIGMCGPLSLALPIYNLPISRKIALLLLYQVGRVTTYTIIGLLMGLAGRTIYLAGYQQYFSIFTGILLLAGAVVYYTGKKKQFAFLLPGKLYKKVQAVIVRILSSSKKWYSFFLLGLANGLLPCGMVYIALAATLSFTELWYSVGFMASFGTGTLPAMLLVGIAASKLKPQFRNYFNKLVPGLLLLFGIFLVLRGLNLGMPFISPILPNAHTPAVNCH